MSKIALLESHQTTQRSNVSLKFIDSPDSNCESCLKLRLHLPSIRLFTMAIQVVEFSNGVYKIRKIFA